MPNVFTPDHSALDQIFAKEMRFIIPEYQRAYSWQAEGKNDRNNQINQMWDDLLDFFKEMEGNKEYFFGSMVIIEKELRTLEVVDGQQRLTSLVLLFSAMRCFLGRCLEREGADKLAEDIAQFADRAQSKLGEFIYNEKSFGLAPELKVKIDRSAGYDYDEVLNKAAGCEERSSIGKIDAKYEEIARRYFDNRDYFIEQIEATFLDEDRRFGKDQAQYFDQFFTFLQTRVAIVLIKTTDFETAYSIFEILNNRGLPLSNTDLFRNFVINKFSEQAEAGDGAAQWYRLEDEYALTEDFTVRWVESMMGSKQRQSAFNGIQKVYEANYEGSVRQKKIEVFYADLERDLAYYSLLVEPDDRISDPGVRDRIKFIGGLGNQRYSTTLLLALFRFFRYSGEEPAPEMIEFLQSYERYALSIWLRPRKRFSSAPIYQAIRFLREQKVSDATRVFALEESDLRALSTLIDGDLDNSVARLLLAGFVWASEEEDDDVVDQRLVMGRATLEHILPLRPKAKTNWFSDFSADFRKKYTRKIGNMTLLTSRMNSRAKNYDFSKKKIQYQKTALGITRELVNLDTITEAFIDKRHARIVKALRARWSLPTP